MRIFPFYLWPTLIWQWIVEQFGLRTDVPAAPADLRRFDAYGPRPN